MVQLPRDSCDTAGVAQVGLGDDVAAANAFETAVQLVAEVSTASSVGSPPLASPPPAQP